MKQILRYLTTIVLAGTLFITTSCSKKAEEVKEEKIYRLTYSIFFPPTHIQCKLHKLGQTKSKKELLGRVEITLHPGGSLTPPKQVFEGVVNGASDIGMSCFAYTEGVSLLEGIDLPLGYPNGLTATRAANAAINEFSLKELEGVQVMYLHAHGPGVYAGGKPVKSYADLTGLKIRGTGLSSKVITALGGVAVGMSQNETYEALRKGTVDATLCPIETLKGWRQGEVVKYITPLDAVGYTTSMFAVMNKDTWEKLPEDVKEIISTINSEWIDKAGNAWDQADAEGSAFVKELGREINLLSKEDEAKAVAAVKPIIEDYVKSTAEKGLPGEAVLKILQREISAAREADK